MKMQMHFFMRHKEALIGWNGWMGRWPMGNSLCISYNMNRDVVTIQQAKKNVGLHAKLLKIK